MATNLFKRLWIPNPDGSNSTTPCTNANTGFFHTYLGDDSTGNGTRELPFKSYGRTALKSGISYINFRGVLNEYFNQSYPIMGDDINQTFINADFSPFVNNRICNLTYDYFKAGYWIVSTENCIQMNDSNPNIGGYNHFRTLFKKNAIQGSGWDGKLKGCTLSKLIPNDSYDNYQAYNSLIVNSFDTSNRVGVIAYCVFPSTCIFKFNGIVISQPIWTNDSKLNVQILRNSYLAAGMNQAAVNALFVIDSFGNETCRVVKEVRNGGISENIFSRYDDGNILDYTLNANPLNEVLHASDVGGFVGCFSAAIAANNWGSIISVNADGSDDVVAGQLLQSDFTFSHASGQTWNRIQSAVEKIEKPGKFKGLNCETLDGTPWGDYFGKKQNLVSDVALNPTDALEPNTRYKVANTADHTNYAIVIYKGVQYPPDFFFVTDATNLTFDLLNAGSGSVVRKVFATPLESGEIIPFDDYTTPSAFPRFSAPFMGDVLMLFHKIGANINQPVLFSEVTNDKMAYYANWAVTNADQEFVTLASDTVNYYYKIPILTYYKKELNAHFDANYDQ